MTTFQDITPTLDHTKQYYMRLEFHIPHATWDYVTVGPYPPQQLLKEYATIVTAKQENGWTLQEGATWPSTEKEK